MSFGASLRTLNIWELLKYHSIFLRKSSSIDDVSVIYQRIPKIKAGSMSPKSAENNRLFFISPLKIINKNPNTGIIIAKKLRTFSLLSTKNFSHPDDINAGFANSTNLTCRLNTLNNKNPIIRPK